MYEMELVVWFRGHVIVSFCHIVVSVFQMARATDSAEVLSDFLKIFPEKLPSEIHLKRLNE